MRFILLLSFFMVSSAQAKILGGGQVVVCSNPTIGKTLRVEVSDVVQQNAKVTLEVNGSVQVDGEAAYAESGYGVDLAIYANERPLFTGLLSPDLKTAWVPRNGGDKLTCTNKSASN